MWNKIYIRIRRQFLIILCIYWINWCRFWASKDVLWCCDYLSWSFYFYSDWLWPFCVVYSKGQELCHIMGKIFSEEAFFFSFLMHLFFLQKISLNFRASCLLSKEEKTRDYIILTNILRPYIRSMLTKRKSDDSGLDLVRKEST